MDTPKKIDITTLIKEQGNIAVVIYQHLEELEYDQSEEQKKVAVHRKAILNLQKRSEKVQSEINEAKGLLKDRYQVDVDALRVIKAL